MLKPAEGFFDVEDDTGLCEWCQLRGHSLQRLPVPSTRCASFADGRCDLSNSVLIHQAIFKLNDYI